MILSCSIGITSIIEQDIKKSFLLNSVALSVWSVYTQVIKCQKATNDMLDTAINATETRDEIEKIKVTEVLPLFKQINDQVW